MTRTYYRHSISSIFVILFAGSMDCTAQNFVAYFNKLRPTTTVRAPEFDVEKKYTLSIDSVHQLLIIQDSRRSPGSKQRHFDQLVYEIPLSDLSVGSFKIVKEIEDKELINLRIGTIENRATIINYFLRDDVVVAIQSQDIVEIGPWEYDHQFENDLKELISLITQQFPNKSYKTNLLGMIKSFHKYASEKVTAVGPKDSDKRLSNGYYYAPAVKIPPYYSNTRNNSNSWAKIAKHIRVGLKKMGINLIDATAVFVYVDSEGHVESVYFHNLEAATAGIDLSSFDTFSLGKENDANVKSKLLLVIKD